MTKCPYCETELDLKLSVRPVEIDHSFKNGLSEAIKAFLEIQAGIKSIGSFNKEDVKEGLKNTSQYLEKATALPIVLISCKKCGKTLNASLYNFSDIIGLVNRVDLSYIRLN